MKNLLLILSILIIFSCKNDSQNERLKSALNFESEMIQQFRVAQDSLIIVHGKKGTKISFNSKDLDGFLLNDKDSLNIRLIELVSKADLLLANTQTISNGKWLISGGAFNINIIANGEPLSLKKGKTIKVEFPLNTKENNMELFYGERDNLINMNWKETNTQILEKKYFTIYYNESEIDEIDILKYQRGDDEDESSETKILIDTLGFKSLSEFEYKYPKIDTMFIKQDTLRALESYLSLEEIRKYNSNKDNFTTLNKIYETVKISKLGWVNIDKFAPEEIKVTIKLMFNIDINSHQSYIIDNKNNTILNVYKNEVDIPIDRSFTFLSFGLKEDTFYSFKKTIRFSKNENQIIELKKVNQEQLLSLLKLD